MAKKCTCGKSPNGYCIGLHNISDEEYTEALEENRRQLYGDS